MAENYRGRGKRWLRRRPRRRPRRPQQQPYGAAAINRGSRTRRPWARRPQRQVTTAAATQGRENSRDGGHDGPAGDARKLVMLVLVVSIATAATTVWPLTYASACW